MIFAYMQIAEDTITHLAAYHQTDLRSKRMGNKNPNGNILVDADDIYNRFDAGVHKHQFPRMTVSMLSAKSRTLSDQD